MKPLEIIGYKDTGAATEIIEETYRMLQGIDMPNLVRPGLKTSDIVGISGVCIETSDAVTRAAHNLGIVASRESHVGGHFITSFGPLDELPSEADPILCMTWGQFDNDSFERMAFNEFFGRRRDIIPYIGSSLNGSIYAYGESYSAGSIIFRQITHRAPASPGVPHRWLNTSPEDIDNGSYPIGQVDTDNFPNTWEPQADIAL